jgi:pimeloyl-ACP methyl ester carboxylesterase
MLLFKLVGHSMGGSVVVRACPMLLEHKYKVAGVAVLDVVEGEFHDHSDPLYLANFPESKRFCHRSSPTHAQSPERPTGGLRQPRARYRVAVSERHLLDPNTCKTQLTQYIT